MGGGGQARDQSLQGLQLHPQGEEGENPGSYPALSCRAREWFAPGTQLARGHRFSSLWPLTWGQQRLWTSFPGFDPAVKPSFWVLAENCPRCHLCTAVLWGRTLCWLATSPTGRGHIQLQAAPHGGQTVLSVTHAASAHPGSLCVASPLRLSDSRASTFCRSHHRHTRYGLRRYIFSL